jgi:hypothetical protein
MKARRGRLEVGQRDGLELVGHTWPITLKK